MPDTRYGYSSGRVKALERTFLTQAQIERLLAAKDIAETYKVLQDTFLSSYLSGEKNMGVVFEHVATDAKTLIASIAPDPELFEILWLRSDFQNASTIIKGLRAGWNAEKIKSACTQTGTYAPEALLKAIEEHSLRNINTHLARAIKEMQDAKEVFEIDMIANYAYFAAIKEIAEKKKDADARAFVKLLIDLFNLKSALRSLTLKEKGVPRMYISGGSFREDELAERGQIIEKFSRVGNAARWQDALRAYEATHDHTYIEKVSDEIIAAFWKDRSVMEFFSPAPLFSYWSTKLHDVQFINSILTEKEAGLSGNEIRSALRALPK